MNDTPVVTLGVWDIEPTMAGGVDRTDDMLIGGKTAPFWLMD